MSETPANGGVATPMPEIGGHRLLRVLGTGGMSTVYLGEQVSLGRQVAIKVMLPEALADEVSRRRFENEARTIARLEHPHIVGIHEVGRTRDGLPYYSMPHLPRGHLGQRIVGDDGRTMEQARIREILQALLSALGYAHMRGTVHRDVKAENVLFDEAERPLLADFGIALRRGFGTRVTTAGLAVGSTAYMAPEQARGDQVDQRADLYSVGVLAWEMLTGELPFNAGDALSMAVMHAKDPIPRLPPGLRHWQRFLDRALSKGPGKRYRDAAQMREALDRVPQRTGTHEALALPALRAKAGRLRRVPALAWIGLVLLLAAGAGVLLRNRSHQDDFYRATPLSVQAGTPSAANAAAPPAPGLPIPGAAEDTPVVGDDPDPMLRAAPTSDAEGWVAQADQQIRAGHLTLPEDANAFDSLLAAWQSDPAYLGLADAVDRLIAAFAAAAVNHVANDDDASARTLLQQATQLAKRTGHADSAALAAMRARLAKSFASRIEAAAAAFDHEAARQALESAKAVGLGADALRTLAARANAVPKAGEALQDGNNGMVLVRDGSQVFAASARAVSRDDYARFTKATGRDPALCRERASLLRIVSPRDWMSPGFSQTGDQAVVCVSWQDANAYARWLGERDGLPLRLPHAREAALMPPGDGARRVGHWDNDCSGSCDTRISSGATWRGETGARPLDSNRGYDDVGIRLVRDLPRALPKR